MCTWCSLWAPAQGREWGAGWGCERRRTTVGSDATSRARAFLRHSTLFSEQSRKKKAPGCWPSPTAGLLSPIQADGGS